MNNKKKMRSHLTNALTFLMGFTAFAHSSNVYTLYRTMLEPMYGIPMRTTSYALNSELRTTTMRILDDVGGDRINVLVLLLLLLQHVVCIALYNMCATLDATANI